MDTSLKIILIVIIIHTTILLIKLINIDFNIKKLNYRQQFLNILLKRLLEEEAKETEE